MSYIILSKFFSVCFFPFAGDIARFCSSTPSWRSYDALMVSHSVQENGGSEPVIPPSVTSVCTCRYRWWLESQDVWKSVLKREDWRQILWFHRMGTQNLAKVCTLSWFLRQIFFLAESEFFVLEMEWMGVTKEVLAPLQVIQSFIRWGHFRRPCTLLLLQLCSSKKKIVMRRLSVFGFGPGVWVNNLWTLLLMFFHNLITFSVSMDLSCLQMCSA